MEKENTLSLDKIKSYIGNKMYNKLIKHDVDPNMMYHDAEGKTVFMEVASRGITKLVKYFLTKVVDLDLRSNDDGFMYYGNGLNVFHYACLSGKIDTVEALLNAGADINSLCKLGRNGLMYASMKGMFKLVEYLITKGIDVNAKDNEGMTALMYAYKKGTDWFDYDLELIRVLTESNADLNLKDKKGQTALTHYIKRNEFLLTQRLLEKGADPNASDENILFTAENIKENSYLMMTLLKEYGAKEIPYWVQIDAKYECQECNQDVQIISPLKKVQCPVCFQHTNIPDKFWKILFKGAEDFNSDKTQYYSKSFIKRTEAHCLSCGKILDVESPDDQSTDFIECKSCGQKNILSDPQDWFKNFMISYRHPVKILSDLQDRDEKIRDEKPVALKCTSCSAVLSVTDQTRSNFQCKHCGADQQLPNEVWKALHQGKSRQSWYILSE